MIASIVSVRKNVHLKNFTWLGAGGPADILFKPSDINDLVNFMQRNKESVTIIGVGSNILVGDSGIRGVVVRLGRGFNYISCSDNFITAGAAVLDNNLAKFAMDNGIGGLEFFIGIPGTVGGALAMNAGCYGSNTASVLQKAKVLDDKGNILVMTTEEIGYVYRGHGLPKDWVFLEATFAGKVADRENIKSRMDEITDMRNKTQPVRSKTCGSIFKNPSGHSAWKLIEQAGCKGFSIGDAQISDLHCNFLINRGNATSQQLKDVCEYVREKVKVSSGVELEWEIVRLGN